MTFIVLHFDCFFQIFLCIQLDKLCETLAKTYSHIQVAVKMLFYEFKSPYMSCFLCFLTLFITFCLLVDMNGLVKCLDQLNIGLKLFYFSQRTPLKSLLNHIPNICRFLNTFYHLLFRILNYWTYWVLFDVFCRWLFLFLLAYMLLNFLEKIVKSIDGFLILNLWLNVSSLFLYFLFLCLEIFALVILIRNLHLFIFFIRFWPDSIFSLQFFVLKPIHCLFYDLIIHYLNVMLYRLEQVDGFFTLLYQILLNNLALFLFVFFLMFMLLLLQFYLRYLFF